MIRNMYIHKTDGEFAYVWGPTKADAIRCLDNPENAKPDDLKLVKIPTRHNVTTGASCASTEEEDDA